MQFNSTQLRRLGLCSSEMNNYFPLLGERAWVRGKSKQVKLLNPSGNWEILFNSELEYVFELKFHIWENSVKIFAFVLAGVLIIIVH